ncbi:glutathione synthetase [Grosmannia clavigera kw1407]|uniref:Glutathione synthetase n=1 Tax=Grosmannia clavigera (strain kw1407 / UAMH 11150) TaxID=655863 RepID=F0XPU3_GROCL|nr:glutathione synthetase [Grosmannia clavigera kw1407]EFX00487.1 glutathione synthetase [Grosmannia clavigera kw1407]
MASSYPPAIAKPERQRLVEVIKDWSIANGLTVRPMPTAVTASDSDLASSLAMPVPVTLFPSPFPRAAFHEAQAVQTAYNELYAGISQDEEFLSRIIAQVIDGDDFTASLWNVHLRVKKEGYTHKHSLGIFRSDYLVHQEAGDGDSTQLPIKQVEFNTIAASFGGLSVQAAKLHRFLAETEYGYLQAEPTGPSRYDLPASTSSQDIAAGLRAAFDVYDRSEPATLGLKRCVLFLVQDGERNVFDQRHIEYHTSAGGRVPVFRVPFSAVLQSTRVADTPRRQLLFPLPTDRSRVFEVAVVYLRAGYGPSDYPDAAAWEGRYHIERTAAIKCPTVLTQAAGTKKVQQVLATPVNESESGSESGSGSGSSELGRFVAEDSDKARQIRRTFTNIYPLDTTSAAGRQARIWAQDVEACRRFVLKPQREGGGNNYYKDKIPAQLKAVPEEHWPSYILMELITPPPVANVILRNGQTEQGGVICELGVYGTCIWAAGGRGSDTIVRNETAGYLLRTKGDQSEEGGVAAGFGCMDSVNLV